MDTANSQQASFFNAILAAIHDADDFEINQIIQAVVLRFSAVYPDWEVMVFSVPKSDPQMRRIFGENLIAYVKDHILPPDEPTDPVSAIPQNPAADHAPAKP